MEFDSCSQSIDDLRDANHLNTVYKIRAVLTDTLARLKEEPVAGKLRSIKEMSNNDLIYTMQYALPVIMQVKMQVLKNHGFATTRETIIEFTRLVQEHEKDDASIRQLNNYVQSYFLPPMQLNYEMASLV